MDTDMIDNMKVKETNQAELTTIERKNYTLYVSKFKSGRCLQFLILPKNYHLKLLINNVVIILITYLSYICLKNNYKQLSHITLLIGTFCVFALSNIVSTPPEVNSFMVLKNYGIQVSSVKGINIFPYKLNEKYFKKNEFYSENTIVDIIINEGFKKGFQVVFYLALIIRGAKNLTLLLHVCILRYLILLLRLSIILTFIMISN
ncbi:hypothetical protein TPHA_0C03350 [Tetrapisispora phaffii CBS 4417]|uniref:Phosphatidylinositol N-acetylglucosaminyltransferase subunit H conserved domain-containing protein n=1 Tax=Tetrapisispora phaffii (strain ATCC 24235 / CBS 4417 / NBRC 1672 / NRRL Y-8282 / UCD 70-5) TaxID=1071381 RepID=G8BRW1_TETPH|nr:hypothetical protein TPHA_0C03350 [Tetrapisispora phaffii CBS 4417]CCE62487.1 hypothetical protein TPHA_0C03350 [Tetrapisispora phaffii CBS 4417]